MNPLQLRIKLFPLGLSVLAAGLCSCATSSVIKTWKSPDGQHPGGKIAVLAVDSRGLVRKAFENRAVTELRKIGAQALVTYDLLSLPEIKQDKRAAAEQFLANGAKTILILRLADISSSYREIQPSGGYYATMVTGFETVGWYDYYSVGFMNMNTTYGSLKQKVYLQAGLYDIKTEKCLWSGITKTVLKEDTDRVAEMDPLVRKIIAAMQKDNVVP
jgi:hypothetical protein